MTLLIAGQAPVAGAGDDIFQSTNLLRLTVEIPEEGRQMLREGRARNSASKPEARATVTEEGRVYTNVTVQLKGYTTFQRLEGRPSLTLDFNKHAPGQKFHGLTRISLNNSLQDVTRLGEKLSRELFAAAGVPVPRADYAMLTLDGRDLGLYVLAEGYDKTFLKRHFTRADGELYEGGTLSDIQRPLQLLTGQNRGGKAAVARLIAAAQQQAPEQRWRELNATLDMDRFISMMAMETILCHSDSYSMNRNNYRLYHEPTTGKLVFMPHGMDRVLGQHRSALDLAIVPPSLGLVARAVLSTTQGRRAQIERVGTLLTNCFDAERLCRRVREIDARIASVKAKEQVDRHFDERPSDSPQHDADDLCQRLAKREADVRFQLAYAAELLAPPPTPKFETNGVAELGRGWSRVRTASRPEPDFDASIADGIIHLQARQGPFKAYLRCRITLPMGVYRLSGHLQATNTIEQPARTRATMLRYSWSRFDLSRQTLSAAGFDVPIEVSAARGTEEIQFDCEISSAGSEAWLDARTFVLTQSAAAQRTEVELKKF